jgi:hypothetical protein
MNKKTSTTSLVPAGYFGDVPPVQRPIGSGPLLQWFNGLPAGKSLAIGWHIQASRCSEELSAALKGLGVERLTVLHRMSGELVEYWSLGAARLIILCNGFSDTWEMRESEEHQGLAYGWRAEKGSSKLKVRVLIAELAEAGYVEPFIITLEGMITTCFLEALQQQFAVLDAFEQVTGQAAPFWGFSLSLIPADKPKMVGSRGKQSPIIPMVASVPSAIDEEYLRAHLLDSAVIAAIVERDLIGKAIQWSRDTARRIAAGEDKEHWETEEYDTATNGASSADFLEEDEPPASKQQKASILNLWRALGKPESGGVPDMSYAAAKTIIAQLTTELRAKKANNKK